MQWSHLEQPYKRFDCISVTKGLLKVVIVLRQWLQRLRWFDLSVDDVLRDEGHQGPV